MALTNCIQCGGQVSPDADKCPHCGTKYFTKGKFWFDVVFGFILGVAVIYVSIAMFKALNILF